MRWVAISASVQCGQKLHFVTNFIVTIADGHTTIISSPACRLWHGPFPPPPLTPLAGNKIGNVNVYDVTQTFCTLK